MAFGKSITLRWMQFKQAEERGARKRDRSLSGKARIKARKIEQRAGR